MQWYHCRACGEEGLTPEEERCSHCGVKDPVTLCEGCGLPVREAEPWLLRLSSADEPEAAGTVFAYHETCYATGKRRIRMRYRPPTWQVKQDRRDPTLPLTPLRWTLGLGSVLACGILVFWIIATQPRPQPVLPHGAWQSMNREEHDPNAWSRMWAKSSTTHSSPLGILVSLVGIGAGLWAIRWSFSRRRALFWGEMSDASLPPDDWRLPPR